VRTNVRIEVRERGKLMGTREVHNVWVDRGREYLASMLAYASSGPDVAERNDRVRYMSVGIGSNRQGFGGVADVPPISTQYPSGSDPLGTNGHQYDESFPYIWDGVGDHNTITTLERPAKFTGNANTYGVDGNDRWLIDDPYFFTAHLTLTEITLHGVITGSFNQVAHVTHRPLVPITEAGLHTDEAAVLPLNGTLPFNPLMAYVSFDTILVTTDIVVEFIWSVKF
jgi:hypothetical protein